MLDAARSGQLRALGTAISPDMLRQTMALFAPSAARPNPDFCTVIRDRRYGEDERHRLDLFLPRAASAPAPILLFVHGGGFVGGDKGNADAPFYNNIGTWASAIGAIGVTMTYRLAPAAGWPAGSEDIAAAVAWLRAHAEELGGDPDRIVAMGQSAGAAHVAGYVAHEGLGAADALAGAIMLSGIYDLEALAHSPLEGAYYGTDAANFAKRSSLSGLIATPLPCLFTVAEHDPPNFQHQAERVVHETCRTRGQWPRMLYLTAHNHLSPALVLGEDGDILGRQLAAFIGEITT